MVFRRLLTIESGRPILSVMDIRKRSSDAYRRAAGKGDGGSKSESPADRDSRRGVRPDGPADQRRPSSKGKERADTHTRNASDADSGGPVKGRGQGFARVPGEAPQSKASKVAKLLVLLGRDEAAAVLSHLSEAEIEEVARHIASLETVDRESASQILSEFGFQMETRPAVGGREVARAILARAFPSSQVEDILFRALGEKRRFFAFLEELQGPQIRALIKDESPAVVAVVLSNMSPQAAAKTLAVLPEDLRTSVVLRIAATSQVDAAVVRRVEESLRLKADSLGKMESENVDGPSALAGILRYMELDKEEALLRELESTDAELASEIEDRLFTVDTLLLLDDRQLANVLASYSDRDLALVLKGKEEEVRRKVLENLSERRRQIVAEEYRFLGPVPRREVSEATGRLLSDLRRMESEGTLIVHRDGEKYI